MKPVPRPKAVRGAAGAAAAGAATAGAAAAAVATGSSRDADPGGALRRERPSFLNSQIPNPNELPKPNSQQARGPRSRRPPFAVGIRLWGLGFGSSLGFGIWD